MSVTRGAGGLRAVLTLSKSIAPNAYTIEVLWPSPRAAAAPPERHEEMTIWLFAGIAMLPPLVAPLWVAIRGDLVNRLVAVQLGSAVTALILVLMSFAFDQSSEIDLPLTLSLLSLPGTLMLTLFLERWL